MRRMWLIVVLALAAPVAPAAAANSLEGTCKLSGQFKFDAPLGNQLRETGFKDRAGGTCTGTLNGIPAQNVPVELRAQGFGNLSCLAAHTTSTGTATLTPSTGDEVKIRFWTEAAGALTQFAARFGGAVSGQGIAYVDFLPYADASVMAACEAGALDSMRYDLVTQTITPMVG
jgi:hypothetical protein